MSGIKIRPIHWLMFFMEVGLMLLAAGIAFHVRFELSSWELAAYPNLVPKFFLVILITQLCFYYNDLYHFGRVQAPHVSALRILQAVGVATLVLLAVYYIFPSLHVGRGLLFPSMAMIFTFVYLWRYLFHIMSQNGRLSRRTLVIGSGTTAVEILRYLSDPNRFAYELVGFLEEDIDHLGPFRAIGNTVGSYRSLFQTALRERIDLIIVALEDRRGQLPLDDLAECKLNGVEVLDASTFWEAEQGMISISNLRPSWLIFTEGFRQSRVTMLLKNVSEFLLASLAMILAAPLLLLTGIAIRLDSRGPVLYRQIRVGARGHVFTLFKFRSMKVDAESSGVAQWAEANDPRVTRVGRFLRRYRLDELPQLFNVIRGEMSIVGPRPERPQFVGELRKKIPCYLQRLAVKPGVTGLAQVRHHYGASEEDAVRKLEYDLYYVKNLSMFLDLSILIDTLKVVLLGRGAR